MKWVKESIRAIPEAHEPHGNSQILLKSKLFWLSDIQSKLDELTELSEISSTSENNQPAPAVRQRYRKTSDGRTLLYKSANYGWLPVLAVEHYPFVCRNVTCTVDESTWLHIAKNSQRHSRRQWCDDAKLSAATKGRYFGKYMATQYHLNAGLMEKFYVWIEDHKQRIEKEERKLEDKFRFQLRTDRSDDYDTDTSSNTKRRYRNQVSPDHPNQNIEQILDDELSFSFEVERGENKQFLPTGLGQIRPCRTDRRVLELEHRVSALEFRNITLEAQVRSMMQALKDAKLLS